jgi:dolichol-phosphate mannosyltransferase
MVLPAKPKVIAVAPAYNEEGKIGETVRRCMPVVDKMVVTDDGSSDNTYREAKNAGAMVYRHKKNIGVGAAFRNGIDYALKHDYDVLMLMGGDNQDSFEDIPKFVKLMKKGNYTFIQGSRYLPGGHSENQPLFRLLTTKAFTAYVNIMTGARLTDASNGFRAIDLSRLREMVKSGYVNLHQRWLDHYCLEIYLLYKLLTCKEPVTEIPVVKTYHTDKSFSKMRAVIDWWQVLKPILWLKLGIKR